MPTDDPGATAPGRPAPVEPAPGRAPRELLANWRDTAGARWHATTWPMRVGGLVLALVAAGAAWWLVRPPAHARIEDLLPRAGASGTGATGPSVVGASGAATGIAVATTTAAPGLVVHVVGAVRAPGVVRVPTGARVLDAVDAAGGLLPDADVARVNLAARLVDGQRVAVPAVGEPVPVAVDATGGAPAGAGAPGVASPAAPIDLNEATEAQLETLPGIGPATAAAIVAHRTQHGPFRSVDALTDVRGIGPAKLEQLRAYLVVP